MPPLLPFSPSHADYLATLDSAQWERMLVCGRRHGIAGRWHGLLNERGLLARVPARVINHLWSEHLIATDRERMARWESDRLARAFSDAAFPVVLLKGAAYIVSGLPPGLARLISDVDILVPEAALAAVEIRLTRHGWRTIAHSDYDEHYYRQWMHELPPMQHLSRGAMLDVHHNILPRTSRLCPNADDLLRDAVTLPGTILQVLAPLDMVLHSIVHGFYGGEFTNCFRDLLDVHELVTHFQNELPEFWVTLLTRVRHFNFGRPAFYALRYCRRHLGTEVPDSVAAVLAGSAPPAPLLQAMDWAIEHALLPDLPSDVFERAALRALYMRSHWIKMPPVMLARHLWRKHRQRREKKAIAAID